MNAARTILRLAILVSFISWAGTGRADYQAGIEAYTNGDYETAYAHLEPEARKGNPKAQFALGLMYQKGKGVDRNYTQAYVWYSKAADKGNEGAVKNREDLARIMTPGQREDAKAVLSEIDVKKEAPLAGGIPAIFDRISAILKTDLIPPPSGKTPWPDHVHEGKWLVPGVGGTHKPGRMHVRVLIQTAVSASSADPKTRLIVGHPKAQRERWRRDTERLRTERPEREAGSEKRLEEWLSSAFLPYLAPGKTIPALQTDEYSHPRIRRIAQAARPRAMAMRSDFEKQQEEQRKKRARGENAGLILSYKEWLLKRGAHLPPVVLWSNVFRISKNIEGTVFYAESSISYSSYAFWFCDRYLAQITVNVVQPVASGNWPIAYERTPVMGERLEQAEAIRRLLIDSLSCEPEPVACPEVPALPLLIPAADLAGTLKGRLINLKNVVEEQLRRAERLRKARNPLSDNRQTSSFDLLRKWLAGNSDILEAENIARKTAVEFFEHQALAYDAMTDAERREVQAGLEKRAFALRQFRTVKRRIIRESAGLGIITSARELDNHYTAVDRANWAAKELEALVRMWSHTNTARIKFHETYDRYELSDPKADPKRVEAIIEKQRQHFEALVDQGISGLLASEIRYETIVDSQKDRLFGFKQWGEDTREAVMDLFEERGGLALKVQFFSLGFTVFDFVMGLGADAMKGGIYRVFGKDFRTRAEKLEHKSMENWEKTQRKIVALRLLKKRTLEELAPLAEQAARGVPITSLPLVPGKIDAEDVRQLMEDHTFFDGVDGGLFRILAVALTGFNDRGAMEAMIARHRTHLTHRDMLAAYRLESGEDPETGSFTWGTIFSPTTWADVASKHGYSLMNDAASWAKTGKKTGDYSMRWDRITLKKTYMSSYEQLVNPLREVDFEFALLPEPLLDKHLEMLSDSPAYIHFVVRVEQERAAHRLHRWYKTIHVVTPDAQKKIARREALFQQHIERYSRLETQRASEHEYDDAIYAWDLDGALHRAKSIAGDPRYPQQVRNRYGARVKLLEDAVAEERVKTKGIDLWRNVGDMGFYAALYGRLSSGARINFGTAAGVGRHIGPFAEYLHGMFNPLSRGAGELFEEALTEAATDIAVSLSREYGEELEVPIGKAIELIIEQGPATISRRIYTKTKQKLESQRQTRENLDPAQLDRDFEESELVKATEELVEEKEREKDANDPEVKQSIERQSEELQGTNSLLIVLELIHQSGRKLRESLPDFKNFLEKVRQRYVDLHRAAAAAASPPTLEKYEEILEHRPSDLFDPEKSLGIDVIRADLGLLRATIEDADELRLDKILEAIDGERHRRFLAAMTDFLGEHGGRIKGVILNGTSKGNPEYKGIFSDKDFTLVVDPNANLDAIRTTVRGTFEKHGVVLNAEGEPQSADIEVMIQTFLPGDVHQIATVADFLLWSSELTRDAATRHLSAGGAMWVGHYNYLNGGTLSRNGRAIVDPEPDPNFLPKPPLHPIFAHGLVLDMARFDILQEVSAIENAKDLAEMLGKRAKYVLRAVDALIWAHANDLVNGRTPENARREGYHALVRTDAEVLVRRGLLTREEYRLVELLVDLKNGKSIYQAMGIAREDAEANRLRLEDLWNGMNQMMRRAYVETRTVHLKFLEEMANDASMDPELHKLLFSIVFRDWNSIRQVENRNPAKMRMLTGITDGNPLAAIKRETQEIIGLGKVLDNIPESKPQDPNETTALPGETPHDESEQLTGSDEKTQHGQTGLPTPPASSLAELQKPFTEEELPQEKREHITGDVTSVAHVKTAMSSDPHERLNLLGEVAAFELARLLDANVPYTEPATDANGNIKAALLRFIESEQLDHVLNGEKKDRDKNGSVVVVPVKVPYGRSREEFLADEKLRRQFIRLRILAAIVGDFDRHPKNYLITKEGDVVGIDHYYAKPFDRDRDDNQLPLDQETVFEEMRKRFIGFDVTLNNNIDPGMRWVEQEMDMTREEVLAELKALTALLNGDLLQATRHYPDEFRERIEETWRLRIELLERLLESVAWPPLNLQFNEHAMDPAVFAAFVRYHQGEQGRSVRSLRLEGRSAEEIEAEISPAGWDPAPRPLKYQARDGGWTKQVRPLTTPAGATYNEVTYRHEDGGVVVMLPEGRPDATDEQSKNPHAWAYVQKDPQLASSEGNEAFKLSDGEPVPADKSWIVIPRELKDEGRIADYLEKAVARPIIVSLHSPRGPPPDTPVKLGLGLKSKSRPQIDYIRWSKENEFQTYGPLSEGVKGGFSEQIQAAMEEADEIHFNLEGVRIEAKEFYRMGGKAGELHDWGVPKSGHTNYELYLLYNNPEFRAKVKWHNGEDPFKNW